MQLIENYAATRERLNTIYGELDAVRAEVQTFIKDTFLGNDRDKVSIERLEGEMNGKVQQITHRQFFDEFRYRGRKPELMAVMHEKFEDFYQKYDRMEELDLQVARAEEEAFGFTHEAVSLRNILKLVDAVVEGKLKETK